MASGNYDFAGKTTSVNYGGQTGWMIPILVEDVKIKAADGACLYVATEDTYSLKGENTRVSNCTFEKDSGIAFTNGADTLNLVRNTFKAESYVYLTGKRDSGWNLYTIKVSSVDFVENVFEKGSLLRLAATETDYDTCFVDFNPVETFGMSLKERKDPSSATYDAVVNLYEKQ